MFAGAKGSSAGAEAATEAPDAVPDAVATGAEAGTEFIGLLDGADTIDAVVDAHLIIFARAAALFACKTRACLKIKNCTKHVFLSPFHDRIKKKGAFICQDVMN